MLTRRETKALTRLADRLYTGWGGVNLEKYTSEDAVYELGRRTGKIFDKYEKKRISGEAREIISDGRGRILEQIPLHVSERKQALGYVEPEKTRRRKISPVAVMTAAGAALPLVGAAYYMITGDSTPIDNAYLFFLNAADKIGVGPDTFGMSESAVRYVIPFPQKLMPVEFVCTGGGFAAGMLSEMLRDTFTVRRKKRQYAPLREKAMQSLGISPQP